MLVELHLLQSFAPSCLNRDDTNAPKDCIFGGVRRARLSSQCLKRAIRWHPEFLRHADTTSVRTRRLVDQLSGELAAGGMAGDEAREIASEVVRAVLGQLGPQERTRALMHVGQDEIARLREWVTERLAAAPDAGRAAPVVAEKPTRPARKRAPAQQLAAQLALDFTPGTLAPDIALFGRMIAENAHFNVAAACQVAHAIATHPTPMEMDFFSAVDDLKPRSSPGSEMIGTVEFNSACFYRYAAVSVEQLLDNLGGDARLAAEALEGFLRASIAALPAGRQNSTAAASPPSFVMTVVRRRGMAWSLVNAFERPVTVAGDDRFGLVGKSILALDTYWGKLAEMYGEDGIAARPVCWADDCQARHLHDQRTRHVGDVIEQTLVAAGLGGV
jgi:CRISPR system Cascade subunit CasC